MFCPNACWFRSGLATRGAAVMAVREVFIFCLEYTCERVIVSGIENLPQAFYLFPNHERYRGKQRGWIGRYVLSLQYVL